MRFSDAFLDEIRTRLPISEVIGKRVTFDRKKTNRARGDFWACCPFHGEKSPSFHCEDRKGRYHCFGCGVSGDHFRFLMELDGLPFHEAVERLAADAGLPMPVFDKREQEREEKRASLIDVMEMAARFFEEQLQAPAGAKARAYLRDRGLSPKTQREFRIGYSPDSRNALKEHLASRGITTQQMEAAGLLVSGPDIPVSYDRFRDRVMFPIPDSRERVIAFGGRALSPDVPAKYLNSPETELFHKSNVLYNFARARKAVQQAGRVIAAEGYMDVIAMHAAGFAEAVAPLGTALTDRQVELMWRLTNEPVLCFDGDEPGLKAAGRAAELVLPLLQPGRSVRFAMLPEGLDPDDLLRQEGPQALADVLSRAMPLSDMIWNREVSSGTFDTPERRSELEARIRAIVATIRHETIRRHYDQDMRDRLQAYFGQAASGPAGRGVRGTALRGRERQVRQMARLGASTSLINSPILRKGKAGIPLRETVLVMGMVNHPAMLNVFFEEFSDMPLSSAAASAMRQKVIDLMALSGSGHAPVAEALVRSLREQGFSETIERMEGQLRQNRIWQAGIDAAFEDAVEGWRQAHALHMRTHTLHRELRAAEQALASDDSDENLERLLQIQSEIAKEEGTEALIDGFGISSGRPSRTF